MSLPILNAVQAKLLFLKNTEKKLSAARIPSARVEAELLIRHFTGQSRIELLTGDQPIRPRHRRLIEQALQKRLQRIPLAYVIGEADFFGRDFCVTPDTLIPRPETEILLEQALELMDSPLCPKKPQVLEIGAGTGCLAVSLTIARPDCRMTALDISPKALKVASKNAKRYGVSRNIRFRYSNLFSVFGRTKKECWDVLISNPPYIASDEMKALPREVRKEPVLALDGGKKGLDIIFKILEEAPAYLKKGAWLLIEIGKGQHRDLEKKLNKIDAYHQIIFIKDLAGIKRVLKARKK